MFCAALFCRERPAGWADSLQMSDSQGLPRLGRAASCKVKSFLALLVPSDRLVKEYRLPDCLAISGQHIGALLVPAEVLFGPSLQFIFPLCPLLLPYPPYYRWAKATLSTYHTHCIQSQNLLPRDSTCNRKVLFDCIFWLLQLIFILIKKRHLVLPPAPQHFPCL